MFALMFCQLHKGCRTHLFLLFGLLLLLSNAMAQAAAPDATTQAEINHLLTAMGNSGCAFDRNGSWYDSKEAQAHLQKKNAYLQKKGMIGDTQDFIAKAATSSSISGKAYLVRCPNSKTISSESWLNMELQRFRKTESK
jgi:hypothetical protein